MIAPHIAKWALDRQRKSNNIDEPRVGATHVSNINDGPKPKPKPKPDDDDDAAIVPVLQAKGEAPAPPPQPSPMEQAQARDWEAQMQADRDTRAQQIAADKQAADKQASDAAWSSGKGAAYNAALQSGQSRLQSLGIDYGDPYGVTNQFEGRLNSANSSLQPGADYSSAFSPTILDDILGSARTAQRNKYTGAFNTAVSPYYAEDKFGATSDDAILSSILDQQYNTALTDLQSAKGRGQATQSVYDRALQDLGNAKYTANADLQNIGQGVRQSDIDAINKRRQSGLDAASSWDFGSNYDPAAEASRVQSFAGEQQSGLEGALRGAVGGKQYFDVNSLIGNAAAKVGNATTPTTTTGGGALFDTFQNQAQNNTRTNEGIF